MFKTTLYPSKTRRWNKPHIFILFRKIAWTRRFLFVSLLWGALGTSRSLGKTRTFEPAVRTVRPNPAKPLLGDYPKQLFKVFSQMLSTSQFRTPLCDSNCKTLKYLGIHQRLVDETSLTKSSLPRRFGEPLYNTPRHLLNICSSKVLLKFLLKIFNHISGGAVSSAAIGV